MNLLVFQNETFFSQSIIIEGSEKLLPQAGLNILNKGGSALVGHLYISTLISVFFS